MKCSIILLVSCLLPVCQSLYFLVNSEKKKCFYIEQPDSTPMTFSYEVLDKGDEVEFELFSGAVVNAEARIKQKILKESGHIDYETAGDGFHTLCFSQKPAKDRVTRFQLTIEYGHDAEHYEQLAKDQNVEPINLEMRKINDEMSLILNEADYMKHKEVEFHEETEAMNSAALWFPMVQIGILLLAGVFQARHLKFFFKSTKVI
mmetsp:Transcript_22675/g.33141  ORF Transcript_22675/g.33141 Transcript_22675/m.33141 type:complete len:204 (+) Transcript_22675:75-686(+)